MESDTSPPNQTQTNQTLVHVLLESWLGPGSLLSEMGNMLLGILLGEFLHRIILVLEEHCNLNTSYEGRVTKLLGKVFSNCHNQSLTVPFLLTVGTGLLCISSNTVPTLEILRNVTSVSLVYLMMRTFGGLDNTLEDLEVLEENNSDLGPGLAINYWFSFLKCIVMPWERKVTDCKGNRYFDLIGVLDDLEYTANHTRSENLMEHDGAVITKPVAAEGGPEFTVFKKFIVLLPSDCNLKIRSVSDWEKENVFLYCHPDVPANTKECQCKDSCRCLHRNCSHNFGFKVDPVLRTPAKRVTVYWIYEREEDECQGRNGQGRKIFLMFDFPMLLQSSMGPGRGWEEEDRPGARHRNIASFKDTLVKCLSPPDYNKVRHLVTFHQYKVGDGRKMSARLRERVLLDGGGRF